MRQLDLPNLPSASGIEVLGDSAYIIGDDSPFLYRFDVTGLTVGQPITLFDTAHFSTGRIPKDLKLDLECLTAVTTPEGEQGLLVLGSGATPAREAGFWVTFTGSGPADVSVYPLSLTVLYHALRPLLPAGISLNLEAAAATSDELLLFQRSVGTEAGNLVFRCPLPAAMAFLRHRTRVIPALKAQRYELPSIDGKPAGFSGASVHEDKLFVTASVEDTTDAVADGAVLGSFVGVLDPTNHAPRALPTAFARLELPNGAAYRGKVESLTVRRPLGAGRYELLLVTDDDAGGSTAVVVDFSV